MRVLGTSTTTVVNSKSDIKAGIVTTKHINQRALGASVINKEKQYKDIHGNEEPYIKGIDKVLIKNSVCQETHLKICSINVGGLMSKLLLPDFQDFVSEFDIICVCETKLDTIDKPHLDGFKLFNENRSCCKRKSGGVGIFVKEHLLKYVKNIPSITSENSYWLSLDVGNEIIVICSVYVPPNVYFTQKVENRAE